MKRIQSIFTIILFSCLGGLSAQNYKVGDLYTAPDGSKGIVYYVFPEGGGGWVVAITDASAECMWGTESDIPGMINQDPSSYYQQLLIDTAGYANTQVMRSFQNDNPSYAAGKVDFNHGWILPSSAQLYILYGQLSFITNAINAAGGMPLTTDYYWCSAERNSSNAWGVSFNNGSFVYFPKTSSSCRVRPVRSFLYGADNDASYLWSTGATTSSVTVSPEQTTTYSVTVSNSGGCADTVEHTIVVGSNSSSEFTIVTSEPYVWDAVTYNYSGTYTRTYTTAEGCDSVVTLHLTVVLQPEVEVFSHQDTICAGEYVILEASVSNHVHYPIVAIGDILCTDGSIEKPSDWPVLGKSAMGVVFYVDSTNEHGWAMHLQDQSDNIQWSSYATDVGSLTNYSEARSAIYDLDGYTNTLRIRNNGVANTFPAAWIVDFENGWYLPAMGQLRLLGASVMTLNSTLLVVGGMPIYIDSTPYYWSSTESDGVFAWSWLAGGAVAVTQKNVSTAPGDYPHVSVRSIRNF